MPPWFGGWPHSQSAAYCLKVVQRLQMDAKTTARLVIENNNVTCDYCVL